MSNYQNTEFLEQLTSRSGKGKNLETETLKKIIINYD